VGEKGPARTVPRRLTALILCAITCLAGMPTLAHAGGCRTQDAVKTADQLVSARNVLLDLPLGEDGAETQVSPVAQAAIRNMKSALAAFVSAHVECASTGISAGDLQSQLSTAGHAFKLQEGRVYTRDELPKNAFNYGFQLSLSVERWREHPTLIAVTGTFQIACGQDSMLMIFDSSSGAWREALRWQSPVYSDIGGAYGAFGYTLSPPDSHGNWYVLVKSIPPWCTSTWRSIRYWVLRPSADGLAPRVVLYGQPGLWFGNDDFGHLTANATDFEVRFTGHSIDVDIHHRIWIERYSIRNDVAHRIQPVALSARDFTDAWIEEDWEDASQWTKSEIRSSVRQLHDALRSILFFQIDAVRKCSDREDHFEVAIVTPDQHTRYLFSIVGTPAEFEMTSASQRQSGLCDGADVQIDR
jgi:hypothetical protein